MPSLKERRANYLKLKANQGDNRPHQPEGIGIYTAPAPLLHILVDQAVWGIPPQQMPATIDGRLEWYRQALVILQRMEQGNSVSWTVADIEAAKARTIERIAILNRIGSGKMSGTGEHPLV